MEGDFTLGVVLFGGVVRRRPSERRAKRAAIEKSSVGYERHTNEKAEKGSHTATHEQNTKRDAKTS
jgi:hypothetical protein